MYCRFAKSSSATASLSLPCASIRAPMAIANDWHLVHLGSRAVGGAVAGLHRSLRRHPRRPHQPAGSGHLEGRPHRIRSRASPNFVRGQGAIPGIQLAHAGSKAARSAPGKRGGLVPESKSGWTPVAPSAIPFSDGYPQPAALDEGGIQRSRESLRRGGAPRLPGRLRSDRNPLRARLSAS